MFLSPLYSPGNNIDEWVAISFSKRSSPPRDQTHASWVSCKGRQVLYHSRHLVNYIIFSLATPAVKSLGDHSVNERFGLLCDQWPFPVSLQHPKAIRSEEKRLFQAFICSWTSELTLLSRLRSRAWGRISFWGFKEGPRGSCMLIK